jgi:hypothetical protein
MMYYLYFGGTDPGYPAISVLPKPLEENLSAEMIVPGLISLEFETQWK